MQKIFKNFPEVFNFNEDLYYFFSLSGNEDKYQVFVASTRKHKYYFCLKLRENKKRKLWVIAPTDYAHLKLFTERGISTRTMIANAHPYGYEKMKRKRWNYVCFCEHKTESKQYAFVFVGVEDLTNKTLPSRGEFFNGDKESVVKRLEIIKKQEEKQRYSDLTFWEKYSLYDNTEE